MQDAPQCPQRLGAVCNRHLAMVAQLRRQATCDVWYYHWYSVCAPSALMCVTVSLMCHVSTSDQNGASDGELSPHLALGHVHRKWHVCCADCPTLPNAPANSRWATNCATTDGSTCTASCDANYAGNPSASCSNGLWSVTGSCTFQGELATCCCPPLSEGVNHKGSALSLWGPEAHGAQKSAPLGSVTPRVLKPPRRNTRVNKSSKASWPTGGCGTAYKLA